jgi:hypothetical protein
MKELTLRYQYFGILHQYNLITDTQAVTVFHRGRHGIDPSHLVTLEMPEEQYDGIVQALGQEKIDRASQAI